MDNWGNGRVPRSRGDGLGRVGGGNVADSRGRELSPEMAFASNCSCYFNCQLVDKMFNTLVKRAATYAVKSNTLGATSFSKAVIARYASNGKRVAIDGNEAAANAIYQVSDAAMLFPITPSSGMGEHCDAWASKGRKNVFGQTVAITQMEVGRSLWVRVINSLRVELREPSTELSREVCWERRSRLPRDLC